MLLTAMLEQARSFRCGAALLSHLRRATRSFTTSRCLDEEKAAQPQTPATDSIELTVPATYISLSHNPWFNLSYEDWLLRYTPHNQPILFMYRNSPCVVIGRNQNPWKETTPRKLREANIPLVRRRSGGGAVYHDLGNTNFAIILPRLLFTRAHGAELVARAIRERLGVEGCRVNKRNDVVMRDGENDYKVSGSAYKIIQHRAYHHGTMLILSSLSELGKFLKSSSPNIETKSIPSFPSPVTTLNTYLPASRQGSLFRHKDFVEAVTSEFETVYGVEGKEMETYQATQAGVTERKVVDGAKELNSWAWQYGQTPEFTNDLEGETSVGKVSVSLVSRNALITFISIRLVGEQEEQVDHDKQGFLDAIALGLVGKRYETLDGAESPSDHRFDNETCRQLGTEVIDWLRKTM